VDRWLGIADASLSVGARELCCLVGVDNSFRKAAGKLKKLGQIAVSAERLRTVSESEGVAMLQARRAGLLRPDWDASDCTVAGGKTQVLVGGDGVMVPVITTVEKPNVARDAYACGVAARTRPGEGAVIAEPIRAGKNSRSASSKFYSADKLTLPLTDPCL